MLKECLQRGDARADPSQVAALDGARVLYVEDNPVNAMLMQCVLERCRGIELQLAGDGASATAAAAAQPPQLLLIDMHLPDDDGCHLLARLRALPGLARIPAVAVSADAGPEQLAQAHEAGFDDYWTKPLDVLAVVERIRGLLGARG